MHKRRRSKDAGYPKSMRVFYIEPRSKQLDGGDWKPVARVFRLIDGVVNEFYPLRGTERTFTSREEADGYALQTGKDWVDRN